ncbi:MAG: DNRLRE domain-containing protein, partial [Sedimentisphaerales bacterium]|nr:DNRLRE domain-containing protein [Sedimentisphaerales bacterium]
AEGQHVLNVEVADRAGNVGKGTSVFTVDLTPPVISSLSPAAESYTKSGRPAVGASYSDATSGVAANSVRLWLDGADVSAMTTIMPGSAVYMPEAPLAEGAHTAKLAAGDLAGNQTSVEWIFYVDTVPPTVSELSPAEGSATNNPRPAVTGRASDLGSSLAAVQVLLDGTPLFATLADGAFSAAPEVDLSEGQHSYKVIAADAAGNVAEATVGFLIDYTPPPAPVVGTLTATEDRVTIHGDTEPEVVEVLATAEGATVERAVIESYTVVFVRLPGGPDQFSYTLRFKDRAGNIGPALTGTASFQPTVPAPEISGFAVRQGYYTEFHPQDGYFTNRREVQLIGTVTGGIRPFDVFVTVRGLSSGEEAYASQKLAAGSVDQISLMVPLFEEANEVSVRAVSADGQEASAGPLKITSDRSLPELLLTSPAKMTSGPLGRLYLGFKDIADRNVFDIRTFGMKVKATDAAALPHPLSATVTCGMVSQTYAVSPAEDGSYLLDLPGGFLAGLADGEYGLQIVVRDRCGNSRTLGYPITRDTTAPLVYGFDPLYWGLEGTTFYTEQTKLRLVGADSDAIRVEHGSPLVRAWLNGPWMFDYPVTLDDSSNQTVLSFTTEDFAGNVGAPNLTAHLWPRQMEIHYYPWGGSDQWGRPVPPDFTMMASPYFDPSASPHFSYPQTLWASGRVAWTLKIFQPDPNDPYQSVKIYESNQESDFMAAGRLYPCAYAPHGDVGQIDLNALSLEWRPWIDWTWTQPPPYGPGLVAPWDWLHVVGAEVTSTAPATVPVVPDWTGEWYGRPLPDTRYLDFTVQPANLWYSALDDWLMQTDSYYGPGSWEKYACFGPFAGQTKGFWYQDPWSGYGYWQRPGWFYFEDDVNFDPEHIWGFQGGSFMARWIPHKPPEQGNGWGWSSGGAGLHPARMGLFQPYYYGWPPYPYPYYYPYYPYYWVAVPAVEDYRKVNVVQVGEGGSGYVLAAGQKATVRILGGGFSGTPTVTLGAGVQVLATRLVEHDPFNKDIVKTIEADVLVADDAALGFRDATINCGAVSNAVVKQATKIESGAISPDKAMLEVRERVTLEHTYCYSSGSGVRWLVEQPSIAKVTAGFRREAYVLVRCEPFDPDAYYAAIEVEGVAVGVTQAQGGIAAATVQVIELDIYDGKGESRTSLNLFGQYETSVLPFQPRPEIQVPETIEVARQATSVTVSGKALDNTSTDNSVVALTVNGQQVAVAQDGTFSTQMALDSFAEKVELKATNYYSISTSATIVLNRGSQRLGGGYFAATFVKSQGAYIASAYPESAARNRGLVVENDSQFALLLFPDLLAGSFMSIPQGAQIVSATLELCLKEAGTGEETTLRIERLVDPQGTGQWKFPENPTGEQGGDEFTPQVGVSWTYKDSKAEPKIAWANPGGDVAENGSAEASAETTLGAVWRIDATDHVKSWQSGAPNLGWRIRTMGEKITLHSNDSATADLRPQLTVVYTFGE